LLGEFKIIHFVFGVILFSSSVGVILVAILVIIVAAVNVVVFNPFKSEYNQQDKSLAAYLLHKCGVNILIYTIFELLP
jgi:hypothetical protein